MKLKKIYIIIIIFFKNCYDWSKGVNDESLVSRYDIYKHDLELFLSKLNIEIEDTDDDSCFDSEDYDIVIHFSDSKDDCDSDSGDF